jgi:hypothetical protein
MRFIGKSHTKTGMLNNTSQKKSDSGVKRLKYGTIRLSLQFFEPLNFAKLLHM